MPLSKPRPALQGIGGKGRPAEAAGGGPTEDASRRSGDSSARRVDVKFVDARSLQVTTGTMIAPVSWDHRYRVDLFLMYQMIVPTRTDAIGIHIDSPPIGQAFFRAQEAWYSQKE